MKTLKAAQLKPTAGYILVEPAEAETKTASGIILPEGDGEKPQYGTVLAVGEKGCGCGGHCGHHEEEAGCGSCGSKVEAGDMVVYKEWGGNKVTIEDKEYQFLKPEDILAIISK